MTQTPWHKKYNAELMDARFISTLTHQAETEARMPRALTSKSWSLTGSAINRQKQILPSVIGWLLFKLCWKTAAVRSKAARLLPTASALSNALELQSYTEAGDPDKDAGYDHMNDALGYLVYRDFSMLHARAGREYWNQALLNCRHSGGIVAVYSGFSGRRQRVGNVTTVERPEHGLRSTWSRIGVLIEALVGQGTYGIRKGTSKISAAGSYES